MPTWPSRQRGGADGGYASRYRMPICVGGLVAGTHADTACLCACMSPFLLCHGQVAICGGGACVDTTWLCGYHVPVGIPRVCCLWGHVDMRVCGYVTCGGGGRWAGQPPPCCRKAGPPPHIAGTSAKGMTDLLRWRMGACLLGICPHAGPSLGSYSS